jgi:tetratricopeptide (TPR) repeat protein
MPAAFLHWTTNALEERAGRRPQQMTADLPLIGRERTLADLREALANGHRAVVVGPRGAGKTAVARALAAGGGYPGGVFWVTVGDRPNSAGLRASVVCAGARCHPELRMSGAVSDDELRQRLGQSPGPILFVFDDVPHRDVLRDLLALCPPTADVLVTSRWPDVADLLQDRPWPRIHLERLGQESTRLLLERSARCNLSRHGADRIGQALNGHPLALRLAGGLLAFASAHGEQQTADDLDHTRNGPPRSELPLSQTERDADFEPAFLLAYRTLPGPRRKRLRILGVVPPDQRLSPALLRQLWEEAETGVPEDTAETAFGLANAGLLERRPDGFHAHSLVTTYARALLLQEKEEFAAIARYLQACIPPGSSPTEDALAHLHHAAGLAIRLVAGQAGHAEPAAVLAEPPPSEDVQLAEEQSRARFTPTELRNFAVACTLAEAVLAAPWHEEVVDGTTWPLVLAVSAHALGRRDAFLASLARPEMAALERPTTDTPAIARPEMEAAEAQRRLADLTHLGWDHYEAGRWEDAEAAYREGLRLAEQLDSADGRISVLNNWGELCRITGRFDQALDLLERAHRQVPASERQQHPTLLHNLGLVHRDRGDLSAARQFLTQAVESYGATETPLATLESLGALAGVLIDLRELDEAERLIEQGLDAARQHQRADQTARFRSRRGDLAVARGNPLDAFPHYQFAAEEARNRRQPVAEGAFYHQMGVAYLAADQPVHAEKAFRQAVELSRGANDRSGSAVSSALLGRALLAAGRPQEAAEWLGPAAQALADMGNRPHEVGAWEDLAEALHRLGQAEKSAEALGRALDAARAVYGEQGAQRLRVRFATRVREAPPEGGPDPTGQALAGLLEESRQRDDRWGEAEALLQQSLIALQRRDPDRAVEPARLAAELGAALKSAALEGAARTNLGEALRCSGQPDDAIEEFSRAIPLLADGDPNALADAHNNLGLALIETNRAAEAIAHLQETVRLKRIIGRPGGAAIAERFLAIACQSLEQFADCAAHARAAAELFHEASQPRELPALYTMAAGACLQLEDPATAAGDLEQAVRAARAIRSEKELARALASLGSVLGFRLDRATDGAAALEEAARLTEEMGLSEEDLGGLTADALAQAAARLRAGSGADEALKRGHEAFARERWSDAADHFSRALERGGAARVPLAAAACCGGEREAARAHLAAALASDPDDPDALYWLAQVHGRQGAAAEGLRAIDQAIAARRRRGTLEPPEAVQFLTEKMGGAMARFFQHRTPPRVTPDHLALHFARAQLAAASGALEAALADLARLLELQPNRCEYYHLRALIHRRQGRSVEAVRDLYQATELEPYHRDFYVLRGDIFVEAGDPAGALEDYGWALRLDSGVATTWASQGMALLALGEFADAAEHLRQAASRAPEEAAYRFWGAVALALSGDASAAAAELTHLAANEQEPGPLVWRALVALMQGDREQAANWLSQRPDDPHVLFWRGVLERLRGNLSAQEHLARLTDLASTLAAVDSLRLRGRLAVLAGDAEQSSSCYAEAVPDCELKSLRLEIGYLDLLAGWFPETPAASVSADLRNRTEARLTAQALQDTRP